MTWPEYYNSPWKGEQVDVFDSNTRRQLTLAETGTYLVRINANQLTATGTYNLGLTCLAPAVPTPTPLACGEVLSGEIAVSGETDLFTFTGTVGDVVDVTLTETGNSWGGSSFVNDPRATIFSPSGEQVDAFDSNTTRQLTLEVAGTYLTRVNANQLTATGTYNLGLECSLEEAQ